MPIALQVMYPITESTSFDFDYYFGTHMPLVGKHMGAYIANTLVTKGLASGPNTPPGHYAIATMVFADQAAMDGAMAQAGPVLADIPNFTDTQPQMLIGEVMA